MASRDRSPAASIRSSRPHSRNRSGRPSASPGPSVSRSPAANSDRERGGSRGRSISISRSRSRTRSRSRSGARSPSGSRSRSRPRTASPPVRSAKVVVERLTKNVNEDHLYEIFGEFGRIEDLDLPISHVSGTNRGTAYILFRNESDAESAIAHMHEAQLDGATINVSVVLPRRKLTQPPRMARRGGNFGTRPQQGPPGGGRGGGEPNFRRGGGQGRFGGGSSRAFDTYRPGSASPPRGRSRSWSRSRSPPKNGAGQGRYRGRSPRPDRSRSRSRSGSRTPVQSRSRSRSRSWSRSPHPAGYGNGGRNKRQQRRRGGTNDNGRRPPRFDTGGDRLGGGQDGQETFGNGGRHRGGSPQDY